MLCDFWHILILRHFCLNGLLIAAKFFFFKSKVTTSQIELVENIVELIYLSGGKIKSWSRYYISQNHNLLYYLLLRFVHFFLTGDRFGLNSFDADSKIVGLVISEVGIVV